MDRAFQRIRSLMLRDTFYSVPPTLSLSYNLIKLYVLLFFVSALQCFCSATVLY